MTRLHLRLRPRVFLPAALLLLVGTGATSAQDAVVIYRCIDANGAVSVQNDVPCARGSRQQRRVMETAAPPAQAYVPPAPAPPTASAPSALVPVIAIPPTRSGDMPSTRVYGAATTNGEPEPAAALLPPPPLFACRTWNRVDYLSDDATPAERCAPLRTTGLGGDPAGGSGAACERVRDTCTPVADAERCAQWRQYLHDTRAMLLFGRAEDPAATRVAVERIQAIVRASDCGR